MKQKKETMNNKLDILKTRALESASNGVIITDATTKDNVILYVNPAFEKMTGYSYKEVEGKNCRFLQGDEKDQQQLAILRNAIKSRVSCKVVLRNFRKDGTLFWNELTLSPIFDSKGKITNFIGVQNDITQRKMQEDHIEELKNFYEQSLNDLPGQVAVFDDQLRYLFLNPKSIQDEELRKWLIGKNDFEYCQYRGLNNSIAIDRQRYLNMVLSTRQPVQFEEYFKKTTGEELFFLRFINPVLNKKGKISQLLAYGIDITDRKKAEHELKYKLLFENLIMRISNSFINIPIKYIDREINNAIKDVSVFADIDRCYIFINDKPNNRLVTKYEWYNREISSLVESEFAILDLKNEFWLKEKLEKLKPVKINDIEEIKLISETYYQRLKLQKVKSMVVVPLSMEGELIGVLWKVN